MKNSLKQQNTQESLPKATEIINIPDIQDTTDRIRTWAITRGLDSADPYKQMLKLMEEVGEIAAALARGDIEAVKDGIGDVHVVQTILSMQLNTSIEECSGLAYGEIKDRTGKMVNGVFVKDSDL